MPREIGYLYDVKLSAIVEITLPPSAPRADLKAALLANTMDQLDGVLPGDRGEITDHLRAAGEMFVDSVKLLEKRDLMDGRIITDGDERLLEGAVRNARPRHRDGTVTYPRWVAIKETFAVGSTRAAELCRRFGLDPEEQLDCL